MRAKRSACIVRLPAELRHHRSTAHALVYGLNKYESVGQRHM